MEEMAPYAFQSPQSTVSSYSCIEHIEQKQRETNGKNLSNG